MSGRGRLPAQSSDSEIGAFLERAGAARDG